MTAFPTYGELESGASAGVPITVALPVGSPFPDVSGKFVFSHLVTLYEGELEERYSK